MNTCHEMSDAMTVMLLSRVPLCQSDLSASPLPPILSPPTSPIASSLRGKQCQKRREKNTCIVEIQNAYTSTQTLLLNLTD